MNVVGAVVAVGIDASVAPKDDSCQNEQRDKDGFIPLKTAMVERGG